MSLTITVRDDQTGETETGHVADGDYALITAEPCRLDGIQTYPTKGTIVLTIRGWTNRKPQDRALGEGAGEGVDRG